MNVVITGASRGIGLELTRNALNKGEVVLAVARRPKETPALMELQTAFPQALKTLALDLQEPGAAEPLSAALAEWNQVDVLINNAGVYAKGESPVDFQNSFQVNAVAPFLITKALLPKLRKSKQPRVIQISTLMASIKDNSSGGSYAYRASKSALNMLNKCLAIENDWLTTVVIHPGWVKTEMGGSGAPLEPEVSATGIWKVTHDLKIQDSGRFFDYRGRTLEW